MDEQTTLAERQQAIAAVDAGQFLAFDQADDLAVLARLRGEVLGALVYSFPLDGKTVYGLGIDGAEACKRELARQGEVIEEDDFTIIWQNDEEVWLSARASRWSVSPDGSRIKLDTALGTKRQEKFLTLRDGSVKPDPHWFEKGCAKAMRNAILRLVTEVVKVKVIGMYKAQARPVGGGSDAPNRPRQEEQREIPTPGQGTITDKQATYLYSIARGSGFSEEQVKDTLKGYGYSSAKQIVVAKYDEILNKFRIKRSDGLR